MKIATIARDAEHSPQMQTNDAAILACVERELAAAGHQVTRISPAELSCNNYDIVVHMSRTPATLQLLEEAQARGCTVLNSPAAVRNCSRTPMVHILQENNIPQPPFTTGNRLHLAQYPCWVKKGDGWSTAEGDVTFAPDKESAAAAVERIKKEHACDSVVCSHIAGDIIKFYGVGNSFFTHSYPQPGKTKFNLEAINGAPQYHPFDSDKLARIAAKAACALGLTIFGGDAIITAQGEIFIIDINDFPSFSAVRKEAAAQIAKTVINTKQKSE